MERESSNAFVHRGGSACFISLGESYHAHESSPLGSETHDCPTLKCAHAVRAVKVKVISSRSLNSIKRAFMFGSQLSF